MNTIYLTFVNSLNENYYYLIFFFFFKKKKIINIIENK